ncbi:copper-binding protein, partial [Micromonospora zamorensis]
MELWCRNGDDTAAGKLTINHGPLDNHGMDAMTMVF